MMKRLLVLALAAACGCGPPPPAPGPAGAGRGPARKPRVRVEPAATREVSVTLEAAGTLEAAEEIRVPARVAGVIDDIRFKEGDAVGPDSVLLTIEVEHYRLAEERAKAEHDRALAQVDVARTLYENRLKLYEEGRKQKKEWITEEQLATWKADLDKAKGDAERTRVDWELARRDHRFASVRPPVAGIIDRKKVSRGEYVRADTEVATILDLSSMYVRFSLPEMEAQRLVKDQELVFSLRHEPDRPPRKARLFHTGQKADESTRAVECKALVIDREGGIRAGSYATVTLVLGTRKGVTVPERAILPTDRGFVVFVVSGDKDARKVKSRPVRPGLRDAGRVEILEGLAENEVVVVDGGAALRDGQDVDPVAEASK